MRLNIFQIFVIQPHFSVTKLLPSLKKLGHLFSYHCIFNTFFTCSVYKVLRSVTCKYFLQYVTCLFIPLTVSFNQQFLILMIFDLSLFFYSGSCFQCCIKATFGKLQVTMIPFYFLEALQLGFYIQAYDLVWESFCVWCECGSEFCFCWLASVTQLCQHHLLKRLFFSILCWHIFQKSIDHKCKGLFLNSLFSSIYVSVRFDTNATPSWLL